MLLISSWCGTDGRNGSGVGMGYLCWFCRRWWPVLVDVGLPAVVVGWSSSCWSQRHLCSPVFSFLPDSPGEREMVVLWFAWPGLWMGACEELTTCAGGMALGAGSLWICGAVLPVMRHWRTGGKEQGGLCWLRLLGCATLWSAVRNRKGKWGMVQGDDGSAAKIIGWNSKEGFSERACKDLDCTIN